LFLHKTADSRHMSSTPRAKPMGGGKEAPSPRAAKPAGDSKKPKVKKPKASSAPAAPMEMDIKAGNTQELSEADAKSQLAELQKKYGALVVSFNNQQSELAISQKYSMQLEEEVSRLKAETEGKSDQALSSTKSELENAMADLRALETQNMALQKKINKLQVENVSEEEVDQLFLALETKEQELEQLRQQNESMEAEVLTARQLSARGGGGVPQIVEIHHHNDLSDDDDADEAAVPADAPKEAVAVS